MHPILRITRREIVERRRDGRLLWPAVSLLALLSVSFGFGWHTYRTRSSERSAIQHSERERWLSQRGRSPHTASHQGVYVFRPEPLLAAIDPGIDSFFGIATLAEDEQRFFEWKPAEDELVAHRFVEISVASILEFIIPLFLILLLYSIFTHDRETGILRLTMSLGLTRSQYIAGKLIGGLAPILAFTPAILFLLLAMKLLAGAAAFDQAWPALLWMAIGYGLLFGIVVLICLGVSALARSSRSSLLTLLLFWCVESFIVPHGATFVAERLHPTPSAADVLAALDAGASQGKNRDDMIREIGIELMHKYTAPDIAHLPRSPVGVQMMREGQASEPLTTAAFDLVYKSYLARARWMQWASLVSPMMGAQSISMALAGTGPAGAVNVAHAAELYRYNLVQTMDLDIALHRNPVLPVNTLADDYHRGFEVWSQVPDFAYTPPATSKVVGEEKIAFGALLTWVLISATFCWIAISKMRVDA